jgi:hypothetical protein
MTNSKFKFLTLLVFLILLYSSCRKNDRIEEPGNSQKPQTVTEKFFIIPATTNLTVKAIAASIVRQNAKNKFVEDLVKKIGYPRWDKAMIANPSGIIRSESEGGYNSIVYIPFTIPDSNTTAAVLAVGLLPSDTVYNLLHPQLYQDYGFDTTAQGWNARNVFQLFTEFNNAIFGHSIFTVTDGRIFGQLIDDTLQVTRLGNNTGPVTNTFIQVCMSYTILPAPLSRVIVINSFAGSITVTVCNTFWINSSPGPLPTGGGGGDTGGGGSSGTGWPYQPPCPAQPRTGPITNIVNPGPCSIGWIPADGGGGSSPPPSLPPYIFNYLSKNCLKTALNNLSLGSTNTFFRQIFNVFDTSSNLHLYFSEASLPTAYGSIIYLPSSNVGPIAYITLDTTALLNCSQEWMAYVIIHEIAHAGLYSNIIQWDTTNSQHEAMMSQYLTRMALGLTTVYPGLSLYDAYAMCYAGFNNGIDGNPASASLLYVMLREIKRKLNNPSVNAQQLISRGEEYTETGTKGLRQSCN